MITYYSEGGGKANVGADIDYYLNAQASIAGILREMGNRGYNLGNSTLPSETELARLMAELGSNIGTWALGELERRVKSGQVTLIPEAEYLKWFSELPPSMQREVTEAWGPAPGNMMVYRNSTGKYIVIPTLQFGNILLAPEPVWGWLQDNNTLYSTGKLPPTHNLLAFYWWIRRVYSADAILSVFSLVPLMPGKQEGLSSRDWGAVLLQDMPIIHVLPMDAPAIFDRRRASMLIINFMTPVLIPSGLYGNLSELYENIKLYRETVDGTLRAGYMDTIINQSRAIGFNYTGGSFEEFLSKVTAYLDNIRKSYIPYGPHVLGRAPEGSELIQLLIAMLPGMDDSLTEKLLREVVLNNRTPEEAQIRVTGSVNATITGYLNLAVDYAQRIRGCTAEVTSILNALEGGYITPGPRGDPIRNPDALPTGRNPYPFDSRIIPTRTAWETAVKLVDSFLSNYLREHGAYPSKVAHVLWASETMRHQGVMEAEILYLMGVKPIWDSRGRVKDVELMRNLTRPRIDVMMVTSGLYRDLHMDIISLLDRAVKLAAEASDTPNYVRDNSEAIYRKLRLDGYSQDDARKLSLLRIFSEEPGAYSPGLQEAIPASDTWSNRTQLADFYLERVSAAYGANITGVRVPSVFRENLRDVCVAMFSRSSNLYGALEHPMVAAYFGGLSMAVERVSGVKPAMYINNLRADARIEPMEQFLSRDLTTRYFNPRWLEGMMKAGYDGARYMDAFVENLWMWQITNPELVSQSDWDRVYSIYMRDSYGLGLREFFGTSNPYARASIAARLLETVRKGYWSPSADVKAYLANEYITMVNQYGVVCCHHTCANIVLNRWIVSLSTLNSAAIEKFRHTMAATWSESIPSDGVPSTGAGGHSTQEGSSPGVFGSKTSDTSSGNPYSRGDSTSSTTISTEAGKSNARAYEVSASSQGNSETSQMPLYALTGVVAIVALLAAGYFLSGRRIN
ncbi:cobaltochelatase subunit CobN [Methanothermobacter sp.]|uniref:cobaltochelatase subunit CobN n=1 Tax=Methanothermobacter sp. TaxID=1884223 RepID=UPI002633BFAC|nr:cobaltochelatase subunit CobN [Methanothermobacter sp.]MDI9615085.1 cobaltochelatase subunit CobN [Methanothermobacter sp.]